MTAKKAAHRKVRTGCVHCKRRRVKCDESKPVCKNCSWHELDCTYVDPPITAGRDGGGVAFTFEDFKLLHHWKTSTAASLALNESLQRAMRDVVPVLALEEEFLMHALLALSALHLAYLFPGEGEKYEALAARHQSHALPLFRSALANVTETNCHALYACGHLVTKYNFARPQPLRSLGMSISVDTESVSASELIVLLRGAFGIYDRAFAWLSTGPLGFCLEVPLEAEPRLDRNPDDGRLARLQAVLVQSSSGPDADVDVCCGALASLRKLLAMVATPGQTMSTKTLAYSWPMQLPHRFIELVGARRPEALVVLAHYCVLLEMIDSFWFMRGCAARILEQCRANLDPAWQRHIEWPVEVVGIKSGESQPSPS